MFNLSQFIHFFHAKGHLLHFNEIVVFLQEEINSDDRAATIDNRRDHRNTLQMNVYLLCQIAECFENQVVKTDQNNVTLTGKVKASVSFLSELSLNGKFSF